MAPSPCSSVAKMPSVSELAFYQPACSAAPLDAEVLADLETTSRDIAYTIFDGRQVPNGWGVVHLTRQLDLLVGSPCAIEALSQKLDRNKARQWGEVAPFRIRQCHCHSCDQYVDDFGRILDDLQNKPGYLASWLLHRITVPAAAPSLPHQNMGESSAGLMAPSPAIKGAATP